MKKDMHLLSRRIYRYQTIIKYQKKAQLLGYQNTEKIVFSFLNTRVGLSLLLWILIMILSSYNYILSIVGMIIFYIGFTYYVFDYHMIKRGKKLEKEAIYFFEIFTLSLQSGKNLIQAFDLTASSIHSEFSVEIRKALKEVEYGKSLEESLMNLSDRIPSDILQNVILNIKEAYTSGGNIISTLQKQVSFMQNKRVMDLKTEMNKIPIKISIISVFLFIPLVLLLLLAPVILEYFG